MKGTLKIILISLTLLATQYITAQNKVVVNYSSNETSMIKIGDTSVMKLIGEVYFYHNNAIIKCDTAYYYYQTNKFEGVSNVIINQDSIYIYGDKVAYDKNTNKAQVYSDIIKITDPSTVMYTRNLLYDTNNGVAEFFGGATILHNSTTMESNIGFFDTRAEVIRMRYSVALKNEEYQTKTDSLDYYMKTEELDFDCRAYIWRKDGDFIQTDKGGYKSSKKYYRCEKDSYVMTPEQELWADTITYYSLIEEVILNSNIQILDTAKAVIGFGDYGQFWKNSEHILLTETPSVINYTKDSPDTIFMRSDTIFVRPFLNKIATDSLANIPDSLKSMMEEQMNDIAIDSTLVDKYGNAIDSNGIEINKNIAKGDSIKNAINMTDSLALDTLKNIDSLKIDSVVDINLLSKSERKAYKKRLRLERRKLREEKFKEWLANGGMEIKPDTTSVKNIDEEPGTTIEDSNETDSTNNNIISIKNEADSSDYIIRGFKNSKIFRNDVQLVADSIITETVDSTTTFVGSPIIWNEDNQITASKIRAYTLNEQLYRARLYGKPILAQHIREDMYNQIKGNTMDAMFRNNEIYRLYVNSASQAIFYKLEDFENSNSKVEGMIYATSENMIINIDSMKLKEVKFFNDIKTTTYPIDKVPVTQITKLDGFKWQQELRPTKKDVFDRTIKSSYRKEAEKVIKPTFYITKALDDERMELISRGLWQDRLDVIPEHKKVFKAEFEKGGSKISPN